MTEACSVRNNTNVDLALVYNSTDVVYVKAGQVMISPADCSKGLYGILFAQLEHVNSKSVKHTVSDANELEIADDSTQLMGTLQTIKNASTWNCIVYGFVNEQRFPASHIAPSEHLTIKNVPVTSFAFVIIRGMQPFTLTELQIADLQEYSESAVINVAAYRDSKQIVHTVNVVAGQTFEKTKPYKTILEFVGSESNIHLLPELTRCETLPPVKLNASYRVAVVTVLVCAAVLIILLIIILATRRRK